jgi:hypothetical protein
MDKQALKNVALALADAIRELKEVPAGHLYARVMGAVDLQTFNELIAMLEDCHFVRREPSHLLVWVGPAKKGS